MTEQQLRHRLAATVDEIDQSSAPLDSIRLAGRSLKRRRARIRAAGLAATVVAVMGSALIIPTLGPGSNGTAPATASPSPDTSDELRPPFPGLKKALEAQLLTAGPEQRRALDDNRVTRAEYRAGFDRYQRCLAEQGYQLDLVDRSGVVIDFAVPGGAVSSGVDTPCYQRHFRVVDMAWQGAHDDRTDDATNMRIVNDCLEANGLSPGATPGEAVHLMIVAGLTDEDCGLAPGQLE